MAPLKFEEDIKDRLEQRAIKPSSGSWKKLEFMLYEQESQKNSLTYWKLGVAASVIGVIIVTSIFINSNKKEILPHLELVNSDNTTIVQENEQIVFEKAEDDIPKAEKGKNHKEMENSSTRNHSHKREEVVSKNEHIAVGIAKGREKDKKESVKESTIVAKHKGDSSREVQEKDSDFLKIENSIIQEKIANVLTHVEELEKNNEEVTNKEVEELLRKAQLEITTEQILKTNTVSASALLLDVESKLDESFKKQVFEALKSGFYKIKTSVVERDN